MLCYKDKMFCNKGDASNEKCRECDRYFDEEKYKQYSEQIGFEMPVAWFVEKPCDEAGTPDKPNFEEKRD